MTYLDSNGIPEGGTGGQPFAASSQTGAPAAGGVYAQQVANPSASAYAYAPVPNTQVPKKSHGWIVAIVVVVVALALLTAVGMFSCQSAVSSLSGSGDYALAGDTVAIIDIDGTIQYDGTANSPEGLASLLAEAEEDSSIKAVVLRVNSGGGTATAGEEMSEYVKNFSKPIVVSSASINASAAYMISSQTDYIYVAKTTEIGSIGVAMQTYDLSGLLEKLGVTVDDITSAESKDSTYGTRALTEEERAYYQKMVDDINDMFISTVAEGRSMLESDVRPLATGLVFLGVDAVENGLADEVGTLDDACAKAASLAGCDDYAVTYLDVQNYDISSLLGLYSSSAGSQMTTEELAQALKELQNDDSSIR